MRWATAAREVRDDVPVVVPVQDAAILHMLRRNARQWAVPPRRVTGRTYWATGRTGLG
ncbi:hypothetical protein [Pseudonocardia sp. NPDC046786]|uniref:hypothetical protein n=1 Tax=Pseudonocardia sp. NPDC046786 TaxID=3155471 RepID=UPI0033CA72C4